MVKFGEFFRKSKPKEEEKIVPTSVAENSESVKIEALEKTYQELLDQERKEIFDKYGFKFVSSPTDVLGKRSNIEHVLYEYKGYSIQFRRFKGVALPDKWELRGDNIRVPVSIRTAEDLKNYIDDREKGNSGE